MATMKKNVIVKRIFEVVDFNGNGNFLVDFNVLTRRYGAEYVVLCKDMWATNCGILSETEFMKMNGDMPRGFFEKVIKQKTV